MAIRIPLNDGWLYNDVFAGVPRATEVRLPHTVAVTPFHYFDERIYQKIAGYGRDLVIPEEFKGKRIFVIFEGVAHQATVYLNGKELATHSCGYTAFEVELTNELSGDDNNRLTVKVNSREDLNIPPFGFVIDYMTYGGIYRECFLEARPENYISDVYVSGKADGTLTADVSFARENKEYTLTVTDIMTGENVFTTTAKDTQIETKIDGIRKWDIDDPNLYEITVETDDDSYKARFGFRDAVFKKDGFYCNGRKVKIRGLNRHQSYPYVGYAMPASIQRYDADIMKKELGLNAVRTSHYPQSQHFIDRCDELGLLVFTEIPGWQHIGGEEWKEQAVRNVGEMVKQYRNHPSIILWGVRINESVDDDDLYRKTNAAAHELDPYRQTGGVRYLKKSSLLEDVYTFNDFSHDGKTDGVEPKANITSDIDAPYLVTEYNGHMYPTKAFDDEEHRLQHALRHANVLDKVAGYDDIAGSFGWCFFDYNTHRDFGSGDRICYHGVCDMFRNKKQAAYVYAACGVTDEPVLEISSSFDIGEHPAGNRGPVYIYTNCDSVKMYKNDKFIKEFTHEDSPYKDLHNAPILIDDYIGDLLMSDEGMSAEQSAIVKTAIHNISLYGMNDIPEDIRSDLEAKLEAYDMTLGDTFLLFGKYIGNWGQRTPAFIFVGYKNGEPVKTVAKAPPEKLRINAVVSSFDLAEKDTYDVAAIRLMVTDDQGGDVQLNVQPFYNVGLPMSIEGPGEIIGPSTAFIAGGMGGTYVKTCGKGTITLTIKCPDGYEDAFTELEKIIKLEVR